jgi:hypothetical protein
MSFVLAKAATVVCVRGSSGFGMSSLGAAHWKLAPRLFTPAWVRVS